MIIIGIFVHSFQLSDYLKRLFRDTLRSREEQKSQI